MATLWRIKMQKSKFVGEIAERYGKLTVIKRVSRPAHISSSNRHAFYLCQCDCGKQTIVESRRLRSGNTRSCGCLIKESNSKNYTIDITGQKFGLLTVIGKGARLGSTEEVCWDCICECGQKTTVRGSELRKGIIQTCGCKRMSHGEIKIRQLLESNQIPYEYEKAFDSCVNINTGRRLRFDFFVNNEYLIEFDGEQHFKQGNGTWGGNFKDTQQRDAIKNEWCKTNNIPLIRIPYTHYNDLSLSDILLSSTNFRVI